MARMPVRDPRDWAFAMTRLPVRFHETEQLGRADTLRSPHEKSRGIGEEK